MRYEDLQRAPLPSTLPVFDADDERVQAITADARCYEVAVAADTVRLYQLLHRREYRPVAVVAHRSNEQEDVRVYFQQADSACLTSLHPRPGDQAIGRSPRPRAK